MASLFKTTSQKLTDALWERLQFATPEYDYKQQNATWEKPADWEVKGAQAKAQTEKLFDQYLQSVQKNTSEKTALKTKYYALIMKLLDLLEEKKYNDIAALRNEASILALNEATFKRQPELRKILGSIYRLAIFHPERTVDLPPPLTTGSPKTTSQRGPFHLVENWGSKPSKSTKRKATRKARKARKNQKQTRRQ